MGKSSRRKEPPCQDLSRNQWDLLWKGEESLRKYGTTLWESGHKTVALFSGSSKIPVHNILRQSGDGREGPREDTRDWSTSLELANWQEHHNDTPAPSREMGQRITDLIHEPAHQTVLEELEEIKELLDKRTPITWLSDILTEELWTEEDFQGGDTPLPPT